MTMENLDGDSGQKPDSAHGMNEPFVDVLDGEARIKIIGAMLDTHQRDIHISEISERSGVARSTIYEHIDELVEMEIVYETREMGGSQMYQINSSSPIVEGVKFLNTKSLEVREKGRE